MYIVGFVLLSLIVFMGMTSISRFLHFHSRFKPEMRMKGAPPELGERAVISFSTLLPFVALSFVSLIFPAMKIVKSEGAEGHLGYLVIALLIPTGCFLFGYYYFKKMVKP